MRRLALTWRRWTVACASEVSKPPVAVCERVNSSLTSSMFDSRKRPVTPGVSTSRFFSSQPSVLYVMEPAKCFTLNSRDFAS